MPFIEPTRYGPTMGTALTTQFYWGVVLSTSLCLEY